MDAHGYAAADPAAAGPIPTRPLMDLSSGYVRRSLSALPRQGLRSPWALRQNYLLDRYDMDRGDVTADMELTAPVPARAEGTHDAGGAVSTAAVPAPPVRGGD